jgi:8-oxo-dGTP pyrophosphatase MutT (NUDIX family)
MNGTGPAHREFAAGALLFRRDGEQMLFLLVYSQRNGIWGFPKGHIEPGESERDAALREIFEETGIRDIRFVEGYREEDVYPALSTREPFKGQTIEKHSVYFLAETAGAAVTVDNDEITRYRWLTPAEALALLPFENMRTALRKAVALLTRR